MPGRHPNVSDILDIMERLAPARLAEPWDNIGLMAGKPGDTVKKAWVALDASPKLLKQAEDAQVQMLLLHHPPIFHPLKNLKTDQPAQAALIKAAASGLNIFAAHTNLDAAENGVNHVLAQCLKLKNTEALMPAKNMDLLKLVVFVPDAEAASLQDALFSAGAGRLGNYEKCSFMVRGVGQFQPMAGANPAVGKTGRLTRVDETRLEMLIDKENLKKIINTLYAVHPYEEPAFDIVPLLNRPRDLGLGRVGNLGKPLGGKEFLINAARRLGSGQLQYAGPLPKEVKRVAVLGGSGAEALASAAQAHAQVLITGEAGYHSAEAASDLNICLVTLGHYPTEVVIVKPWAAYLQKALQRAGFDCLVQARPGENPWRGLMV